MTATKSAQTPPQPLLVFTITKEAIATHAKELIETHGVFLDNLVKEVTLETATFQNVAEALEYNTPRFEVSFLKYVSPDAEVRNAVTQAEQAIEAHTNQSMMRNDVFRLLDAVYQRRASLKLDEEGLRLLERQYFQYQLQGIALAPGVQRAQLQQIQDETGNLIGNFIRNTLQENGGIWFSKSELEGVSEDALKTFQVGTDENEGKLLANFKMPHVSAVLGNCHDSETRRRMFIGNQNKCNSNSDILKRIALLRHQKAQLLGFETHAAEQLSQKMAKTPTNVHEFLTKLQERYTPSAKQELEKLKSLKDADLTARGAPNDGRFYLWDSQYYTRALKEAEYNIEYVEFSQYFALDVTVARMLGIYEDLMGFRFQRLNTSDLEMLSPTGKAEDVIWHEENMVYSVWDENEAGGGFIGYLYMDLHPRPGKFTNAAQMGIRTGCTFSDGTRQYPATALVCNFSPPTPEKPSLLKHSELIALFHELGHGIHNLASKTRYSQFHGTATALDFIEAPSQMLENWCWTPNVLLALSSHWKTGEQVPEDFVQRLIAARYVNDALYNLNLIHVSLFDMALHGPESGAALDALDITSLYNSLRLSTCLQDGGEVETKSDDWAHGHCISTHLVGPYSAGYYGYLWSRAYSNCMFSAFTQNPMDGALGRKYRRCILEHGGRRDETDMITEFLGKRPNTEDLF